MSAEEEDFDSRLLGLVEHMPAALLLTNHENEIVLVNRRFSDSFRIDQPFSSFDSGVIFSVIESTLRYPLDFRAFVQLALVRESESQIFFSKDERALKVEHAFLPKKNTGCEHLWIFTDISERVMADALLDRQRVQMVESAKLKALGEMAGGIAHEINNPLAIIQSRAGYLKDRAQKGPISSSSIIDSVEKINAVVVRISKIVKGLRSFAKDGEGEPFREIKIVELLDETLSFCREKIKNHGVDLIVSPINVELQLECRQIQVSQVLLNLLINAFDAVLELPVKWIKVDVEDVEERIEISVTDSGSGIAESIKGKIFEPFFTTKDTGKGTGLGLSLSMGIVESLGGTIIVDSSCPNTRFVVSLPKKKD